MGCVLLLAGMAAASSAGCRWKAGAGGGGGGDDAAAGDAAADLSGQADLPPADRSTATTHTEICGNGLDDDENGQVDEGCGCAPGSQQPCYPGSTRLAGVGTCAAGTQTCNGAVEFGGWGRCEGAVTPAGELCDGLDNDCDGRPDDGCDCSIGDKRACYSGPAGTRQIGLCRDGTQSCLAGAQGLGSLWGPCTGAIVPAAEACDGADNDCNGTSDDGCECRPGETRSCYGGAAATLGVGPCAAGTQACAMTASGSLWGACAGQTLPRPELCNGIDDDCDGTADDGCHCALGATRPCYDGAPETRNVGACGDGTQTCLAGPGGAGSDFGACVGGRLPGAELCDDTDNDCDGLIDDGCACRRGQTRACYDGPAATAGVGICRTGTQGCLIEAGTARWDACGGQVVPAAAGETCNGLDDDCNGLIDDGLTRACGSDVGDCRRGSERCAAGTWGACTGGVGPTTEDCNGGDEDCDGLIDEGCGCRDGTTVACGGPAVGICRVGVQTCAAGQLGACAGAVAPSVEICNGLDDDCDGMVDEGCLCRAGETRACYDGPAGTAGVAACKAGAQTCLAMSGNSTWGPCTGQVLPGMEVCNRLDDDCDGVPDDGVETPEQTFVPHVQNRDADILFMIDDSLSMQLNQASLIANFPVLMQTLRNVPGGIPNLHIAVVTSSLGAGLFSASIPQCTDTAAGGAFRAPPVTPSCLGPHGSFIDEANAEATKNYDGTIEQAFSCIAQVGTTGCGFEHQLASAAVALGFRGGAPAANQGFLRPGAYLAVVFITNEDDCSAPPDTAIFDPSSGVIASPLGPLGSYRCNEYGHLCGGAKPPRAGTAPVTLADCHSAEDGVLYKVADLASFFLSLKPDPSMIFVSSIAAPVTPYTVSWLPIPGNPGEVGPNIGHSCTRSDGAYADPAVRMAEFTAKFGANGSLSSICDDSYAPALNRLGTVIGRALAPQCLDAGVADADPARPGIQASCQVIEHIPDASGRVSDQPLAACDAATPQGGPRPCWYLTANSACSAGAQFVVNRADPPPAGESITVRCNPCR